MRYFLSWAWWPLLQLMACGGLSQQQASGSASGAGSAGVSEGASGTGTANGPVVGAGDPGVRAICDKPEPGSSSDQALGLTLVGGVYPPYNGALVVQESTEEKLVLSVAAPSAAPSEGVAQTLSIQRSDLHLPLPVFTPGRTLWFGLDAPAARVYPGTFAAFSWTVRDRPEGTLLLGRSFNKPVGAFQVLEGTATDLCSPAGGPCSADVPQAVNVQADTVVTVPSSATAMLASEGRAYQVLLDAWSSCDSTSNPGDYWLSVRIKDFSM